MATSTELQTQINLANTVISGIGTSLITLQEQGDGFNIFTTVANTTIPTIVLGDGATTAAAVATLLPYYLKVESDSLFLQTSGGAITGDITVSGTITGTLKQNPSGAPAFSAYLDTSQVIPAVTATKVIFDTKEFDTNNNFASNRFTPTVAGYYQFNVSLYMSGATGITYMYFAKNGTVYKQSPYTTTPSAMMGSSALIYLNGSTDYVEVYYYSNSGATLGNVAGSPYTYFQGFMARSG